MTGSLDRELDAYLKALPTLLDRSGQYALVKDDAVVSTWNTYEDAIQEGYRLFKLDSFLVKQIQAEDQLSYFTRDIRPPCQSSPTR